MSKLKPRRTDKSLRNKRRTSTPPSPVDRGTSRRLQITVQRRSRSVRIGAAQITRAVRLAMSGRTPAALNVVLIGDAEMARLHERYMDDPRPTDVLTFDLRDGLDQESLEGEIVVSLDTALRQAARFRSSPAKEVLRYCIHGVLHLLGYDDHDAADRRAMRRRENVLLGLLSSPRDDAGGRTRSPTPSRRQSRRV